MIQEFDTNVLDLVKQKGFYPHEYVTDFETFEEKLPSKEKFPWWVKRVVIKIMNMMLKFGMNLKWRQWKIIITCFIHKCDVLLLAHTFRNFRNHSLKNDGLSPSRYLSAPALKWYAMLNMTKFKLEHISDVDMYFFFEKDIKGGVSYISKIYCQVDNKFW